ncbi:hypothetical protein OUZ56_033471 [Daphnia magna]|uniref:Uncharacterized protein n=1 Tax=Daphnia magna TaxID=35525 RepID=A0ABQ9ZXW9_9CRUS|nr:hypothetical protein OUZ56_033471 [Daphnia magna]
MPSLDLKGNDLLACKDVFDGFVGGNISNVVGQLVCMGVPWDAYVAWDPDKDWCRGFSRGGVDCH